MSEHEESAESDPTIPSEYAAGSGPAQPDSAEPGSSQPESSQNSARGRGQRAAKLAGAVTSRTAGWMVAAALAGSLTTLLLDNGTAQPTVSQVAAREAGRMAHIPGSARRNGPGPATRVIYPGPGGPQAAGRSSWVLGPAAPGSAGFSCAFPGPGGPPFATGKIGAVRIHRAWQVIIIGRGHRHVQIKAGSVPAPSFRLARPGCQMTPFRCQAALRVIIKRHGRLVIVGQRPGGLPRRIGVKPVPGKRISVVLPGRSVARFAGPRCGPVPAPRG